MSSNRRSTELVNWLLSRDTGSTIRESQFGHTRAGGAVAGGHDVLAGKLSEIERAKPLDST